VIKITDIKEKRIPSIERENIIYELWNSGKYETKRELAENLKISERAVGKLLYAKEIRGKLINNSISGKISTRTIDSSHRLSERDKIKLYDMIAQGIVKTNEVREYVKKTIKKYKKGRITLNGASNGASNGAPKIVEIQNKTDSQKKIENKITLFQNITFKVMNRLRFNIIKDLPKWAKDECRSLLLMIARHCQEVLEELNQIYPLNKRGEIIEIN